MQVQDQAAVGRVAYLTGYFGASAERYFPWQPLFELLWVSPYFQGVGVGCFVAELQGQVVGYLLGAPNQTEYLRGLMRVLLGRRLWTSIPPPFPLLACLHYLLRAARYAAPHADFGRYPAHLHLNLLPQARGQHLGEALLRAHLGALERRGVPGVQLSTTTQNEAALGLYHKLGFTVYARQDTPLWLPWLGRTTQQVVMVKSL